MASFRITRPYTMPIETLRKTIRTLATEAQKNHGIQARWRGDEVSVGTRGVDAKVGFGGGQLTIDVKLGMMTALLAPAMKKHIADYLDENVS